MFRDYSFLDFGKCEKWDSVYISPECLRIEPNGRARVSLSIPWEYWNNYLASFSKVMTIIHSGCAISGSFLPSPVFPCYPTQPVLHSSCESTIINLSEHVFMDAVREMDGDDVIYYIEVRNAANQKVISYILPERKGPMSFRELVRQFQAPQGSVNSWFPINHKSSDIFKNRTNQRIHYLKSSYENYSQDVKKMSWNHLQYLLSYVVESKTLIKTTTFNDSMMSGKVWKPISKLESHVSKSEEEIQMSIESDIHCLVLDKSATRDIWLWTGQCHCCKEVKWSIEIGDCNQNLSLAIHSGSSQCESFWQELVTISQS